MPYDFKSDLPFADRDQYRRFRLAYPYGTRHDAIDRELIETLKLTEIARDANIQIARTLGIPLVNPANPFQEKWGQYSNGFEMTSALQTYPQAPKTDDDGTPYFTYDGRQIQTKIQTTVSNTDFNPDHVYDMFESVYKAAFDLNSSPNYRAAIARVRAAFLHGTKLVSPATTQIADEEEEDVDSDEEGFATPKSPTKSAVQEDSIEHIMQDFKAMFEADTFYNKVGLKNIVNRCTELERFFIGSLAIELWRSETGNINGSIDDEGIYQTYVKIIQDRNIKNISNTPNPILLQIYPQKVKHPVANVSHYNIVTLVPQSDISSASRSLAEMMFSNDWAVTVQPVKFTHNKDGTIITTYGTPVNSRRSASIARISHKEAESLLNKDKAVSQHVSDELDQVYQAFKKLVIQYAREQLITKINDNAQNAEYIQQLLANPELLIKQSYITALSPIGSKELGEKLIALLPASEKTEMAKIKAIYENEAAQLASTQYCLERIAAEELRFSETDAVEIIRRTEQARAENNIHITRSDIQNIKIKDKSYYVNYMVNRVHKKIPTESFDIFGLNKTYYLAGNRIRREHMVEYVNQLKCRTREQRLLQTELIKILQSKDDYIKGKFSALLKGNSELLAYPELLEMLQIYIEIESYFNRGKLFSLFINKEKHGRIASSYGTATKEVRFASLLGFEGHITCKSGMDRTALLAAHIEASATNDGIPSTNILNSLKHGAHRIIKTLSQPGGAGLQLPYSIMSGLKDKFGDVGAIEDLLKKGCSDQIGKMGKQIYIHSTDTYKAIKKTVELRDASTAAAPMLNTHAKPLPPPIPPSRKIKNVGSVQPPPPQSLAAKREFYERQGMIKTRPPSPPGNNKR